MHRWVEDARFTLRALRRSPSFTLASITSLALGFAVAALASAVLHAYSIGALPYRDAQHLYHVRYAPPGPWEPRGISGLDWTSLADVVVAPIATRGETFYVSGGSAAPLRGLRVNRGFVDGVGLRVSIGRAFAPEDFREGAERVALIGHTLWRTRFASDPTVPGRVLHVEPESGGPSETFRVAGVLEAGFYVGRSTATIDVLVPAPAAMRAYMVRLQPGVPAAAAERRITEAVRRVAGSLPADWDGAHLESVYDRAVADLRPVFTGTRLAAALVLVLVCANVAVLVLLRLLRRQNELAIRLALGGSRRDLARMLLLENACLCAAGAALSVALTWALLPSIAPSIETQLGRPALAGAGAIGVNGHVLLLLTGLTGAVVLVLSVLPVLAPVQRLERVLRHTGPHGSDARSTRVVRSSLIALELAGAVVLLVSCGLMVRSLVSMLHTDLGFETDHLARGRIVLRADGTSDGLAPARFYEQFTERVARDLRASIVFSNWPAFAEFPSQTIETPDAAGAATTAGAVRVGAGYFGTLGIPIHRGRDFTGDDIKGEPVAIVSATLAAQLWPGDDALGHLVRPVEPTSDGPQRGPWRRVVGVAGDVRQGYGDAILRDIYLPYEPAGRFGSYYVRTAVAPPRLWEVMRGIAADLDPAATIDEPRRVEVENTELAGTTFLATLLSGFAAIAAFIAIVGIYGVTAFASQQREREIAIRMAVGATPRTIVRLFLRETGLVVIVGVPLGLAGAAAVSAVLKNRLYGVSTLDVPTLLATVALLTAAAMAAASIPARRASTRNPVTSLKES